MQSSSDRKERRPARFDRVIVFDLDDTLYLERDYVLSGLSAVGQWAHAVLGIDGLGAIMRARFDAGSRTRIFDDSLRDRGIRPHPATIMRMLTVYRQHRPRISLAPDAAAFLAARDARTGFAVITDGFLDAQRRKIKALHLFGRGVHLGVCTDTWGRDYWKPNPRAFRHVEEHFGRCGARCTYVADNPGKDFAAPRLLGWNTIRIARPGQVSHFAHDDMVEADRIIETFEEF